MLVLLSLLCHLYRQTPYLQKIEEKNTALFVFRSGAKLYWQGRSEFFIGVYSHDSSDGRAAVEELKVAEGLRKAYRAFEQYKEVTNQMSVSEKFPYLDFTVEYRYPTEMSHLKFHEEATRFPESQKLSALRSNSL
jgi:hypothetical protein